MRIDLFQQIKIKKIPAPFKGELGAKIIKGVVAIRPKTYACITDNSIEHKKAKGTRKCAIKREIIFESYKDCLLNNKNVYRSQ